jgi:hypothetical protein
MKWLSRKSFVKSIGQLASKFHLLFALAAIVAVYMHVIAEIGISWKILILPGCFSVVLLRDLWLFLYRNGMLSGQGWTRISLIRLGDNTTQINVYPGRPVHIYPGQYIMLWVPVRKPWWHFDLQQHHVQSWAFTAQEQLKLFSPAEPTFQALEKMPFFEEGALQRAFFTGPYGLRHNPLEYETILVIVHDYGILSLYAQLQYIYQCIEDRTSKARRIHLVWQWDALLSPESPSELKVHQATISDVLDKFSKKVGLDRTVIEYHLGTYTPPEKPVQGGKATNPHETETKRLKRAIQEHILEQMTDSEDTKRQKAILRHNIDLVHKQIEHSNNIIDQCVPQLGIYYHVKMWMNATLKRNIDNFVR